MVYECSAGAVVYTKLDGEIRYVIIKSCAGYYGFPKGHIENGESESDAALREIFEETGLRVSLLEGFKTVDEHEIPSKKDVIKRITYFAARYDDQTIVYQEKELSDALLMYFDEAMSVFQFENSRRILKDADSFIRAYEG